MGVRNTFLSSVTLLLITASQNFAYATSYDDGLTAYAAGDFDSAVKDFAAAAAAGDAGAAHMLSKMYQENIGVPKDTALAFKWTMTAAEEGIAQAQYQLAGFYEAGMQGERNYEAAVLWYHRAAQQGYPLAYYKLAHLYTEGLGVEENKEQGRLLFAKAASELDVHAQKGDAQSQDVLASMYEKGKGVGRDLDKALYWYRRAANQGLATAEFNMARMYSKGRGVARSTETALKWLRQAAAHGSQHAQQIVEAHAARGEASLASLD